MTGRLFGWIPAICLGILISPNSAPADEPPIGHQPTVWQSERFAKQRGDAMRFAEKYRQFLGSNKTVREVAAAALAEAKKRGARDLFGGKTGKRRAGAFYYAQVHGKLVAVVRVGKKPVSEGVHVVASHIDAVKLDLKQVPLYADGNMALLETQYYGGIKKYQWLSTPLELRGVVARKDGSLIDVSIGSRENDPVLVIPDAAVHLTRHVDRQEGEEVHGETLDPILSSTPAANAKPGADPFAAEAARLLEKRYGIAVADLASAELELVPAGAPRDVGIDRALIGGYAQDDRACSYAALRAILDADTPEHTAMVILVDREEVGSAGNTGARSVFIRRLVAELLEASGTASTEIRVDRALAASMVFSADVTGAVNPAYRKAYERKNASFLGSGVVWDQTAVHAEVMAYVRALFEREGVVHQPSTWTKSGPAVGATILPYFTAHGMNGLDVSIPLLSMHAPFEVISKADLYQGYLAYKALLED